MKNLSQILIFLLLLSCAKYTQAQLDTVHYIPPMHSRLDAQIEDHYIYLSTPETVPFYVDVKDGSGAPITGSPFMLSNSSPVSILIGNGQQPSTKLMVGFNDLNQVLQDKGLILSAEEEFFANARYRSLSQAEALTSKGRSSSGKEFRIGMMPVPSENSFRNFVIGIMALEDQTVVNISDYDPGVVFHGPNNITDDNLSLMLNEGECYVLSGYTSTFANLDGMIGALVESNKPIVINSGNMCGTIGPAGGGQDMALDQIVPINKIGNKYIVVEGQGNTTQERPMVVAHEDNTQIFINGSGTPLATLQAGDWFLINNNYYTGAGHKNMYIYASEPAYVYQFLAGSTSDITPGLNFMPPVDCSLPKEVDLIPDVEKIGDEIYNGGIFVITETGSVLTINGVAQSGAQAVSGNSDWETYKLLGLTGDIAINSTGGLAVGIYGQSGAAGFAGFYAGFSSVLDVVVSNDTAFCVQDADIVNISASADGGTPPYVFNWNQGLGPGAEHTVFPTSTTEYIVTVTDGSSCTSTDKVVVSINEPPVLSMTPDEVICSGESITIEAGANGAEEPVVYDWNEGLGNNASHEVAPDSYTHYFVTVTDANGCSSTGDIEIDVNPLPSTEITGDSLVCEGASAILDAGAGFESYNWSSGENAQIIVPGSTGNYLVTVTDQNNCTATDVFQFEFSLNPIVLAGQDQTICLGENTILSGEAFGGVEPYTYLWDQGLGGGYIHLISPEETTTYSLTVVDDLGCIGMDEVIVNVDETAPVNITGDTALCEGFSTTLDAGAGFLIYVWNNGDVGQEISTELPGEYIVTVTDANGCTGMDTIYVEVQDSLQPVISGVLNICDGQSATLDAGAGYDQYLWNTGDDEQTISVSDAGNYSVTVTNTAGCSGSISVQTNTYNAPELSLTTDTEICQGDSLLIVAGSTGGEGPYTFSWNGGLATGDSLMTMPQQDTSYIVLLSDINGCLDSAHIDVLVNELPTVDVGADLHICYGDTVLLNPTGESGTEPYTFEWNQSLGMGETQEVSPVSSTLYNLTITDAAGCQASDSILIDVSQELDPAISGQTNFCFGNSSTLSGLDGYDIYLWSTGDSSTTITVNQSGNYSLTVGDSFGCIASAEVDVVVQDSLTPQINSDLSFCTGDSLVLDAGGVYDVYSWNTGDTTDNIVVSAGGSYSITVANADGCNGSDAVMINQYDLPDIISGPDQTICAGETASISATGINGSGPYDYLWDQGIGTGSDQDVTPDQSTTYGVTVTDAQGCSQEAVVSVNVLPQPAAEVNINTSACIGEEVQLSYTGTNNPGTTFAWDLAFANVISGANEGPYLLSYDAAGVYEIILTVDENGCQDTTSQTVEIFPTSFEEMMVDACDEYNWNGVVYDQSGIYLEETVNVYGCDSTSSLVLYIHPSYDTLIEQVVCDLSEVGTQTTNYLSTFGCDSVVTEQYYLGLSLGVSLGSDVSILIGEEVQIDALIEGSQEIIDSIYWEGIPDLDCPSCLNQLFSPEDSSLVTIFIIDENGCVYSDAMFVYVERSKEIYSPNIFSPNNDGVNDFFTLFGDTQAFKSINSLLIYDRWGNKVYQIENLEPNQPNIGWDGTFNGKSLNPGVYVWYAEVLLDDGMTKVLKGDVMLIR